MKTARILAAALFVASATLSSQAIEMTFFNQDQGLGENTPLTSWANSAAAQASFLSYLQGVGTETFEGQVYGSTPTNLTFPGAGTATLSGNATVQSGFVGVGRYPISGSKWVESTTGFKITFSEAVAAFGFYGVDIGDFGGDLTLTFVDGTTKVITLDEVSGTPGGTVMYFGYINTENPFESVTFGNTMGGTDYFGFDDMTIGSVEQVVGVPDSASTLALVGLALMALGFAKRRLA